MKINTAKQRMLEGKAAIGVEVGLGSPIAAEILSLAGFDYALVDQQHGFWEDSSIMHAIRSITLGSAVPMVRIQENDFCVIGKMLDMGALGIVVPMVNTAEQARAAALAARFPPRGGRSAGPFGVASYGSDYMSRIDDEVFLAVQIETVQGLNNAEEIFSVDGVDGCWIGPGDLGKSMGVDRSTQEGQDAHEAALLQILAACQDAGKIPGLSTGHYTDAQRRMDQGFLFVTAGYDDGFVAQGAEETLRQLGRLA